MISWGVYHMLGSCGGTTSPQTLYIYIMKTIDELFFLNSFFLPLPDTPQHTLQGSFFLPSWKNLFLRFPEGFSSELFCITE